MALAWLQVAEALRAVVVGQVVGQVLGYLADCVRPGLCPCSIPSFLCESGCDCRSVTSATSDQDRLLLGSECNIVSLAMVV